MDRERLTELLRTPTGVTEADMAALRSMAERFPWFSGARLLLAVGEHRTGNVLANESRIPAAFLPSREVLFQLVQQGEEVQPAPLRIVKDEPEEPVETTVPEAADQEPKKTEEPSVSPEAELMPAEGGVAGEPIASLPDTAPRSDTSPPETDPAPETAADGEVGPGPSASEERAKATKSPESDILGRMYEESILASSYDLNRWTAPPPMEEKPAEATPRTEGKVVSPVDMPATTPTATKDLRHSRLQFTEWLDMGSTGGAAAPAPLAPPAPAVPLPATPARGTLSQQEILDRFIRQDTPEPPKEKVAFFNPQQAAKQSLKDDGLVSETLARIHEKQGNLAKAKEVYDRLAARHPEKSVYFAALSKALEARMNK